MSGRAETGRAAEDRAARLLADAGFAVLERNFRAKVGEIDLVCRDGDEVVFVEVRARAGASHGGAAASIDGGKRRRLVRAAQVWLQARRWDGPCRFDAVLFEAGEPEHVRGAFDAGGFA